MLARGKKKCSRSEDESTCVVVGDLTQPYAGTISMKLLTFGLARPHTALADLHMQRHQELASKLKLWLGSEHR